MTRDTHAYTAAWGQQKTVGSNFRNINSSWLFLLMGIAFFHPIPPSSPLVAFFSDLWSKTMVAMASSTARQDSASNEDVRRTVILVSRPMPRSVNSLLHAFGAETPQGTPCSAWEPGMAAPRLKDNLCCSTHLAVGVVDPTVWDDSSRSWLERFREVEWWEHRGFASSSVGVKGGGGKWSDELIGSIQAVELLGTTGLSSKRIAQDSKWLEPFTLGGTDLFLLRIENVADNSSL